MKNKIYKNATKNFPFLSVQSKHDDILFENYVYLLNEAITLNVYWAF